MKQSLAIVFIMAFFLAACATDLPPTPPPPGGSLAGQAIAGLAAGIPSWAAQAKYSSITPSNLKYGDSAIISVTDHDYVYSSAYYFNSQSRTWERLELSGKQNQDWIEGSALGNLDINELKFNPGINFLVVYACNKLDAAWECNGNKWMLLEFTISDEKAAQIPESTNLPQMIVQKIIPFTTGTTLAEYDDFGEGQVECVRYDAKYQITQGEGLTVLTHVFDFETREDVVFTINTFFGDIVKQGWKIHNGNNLALFLSEEGHRIAVWSSGKKIIYVQTYATDANKEVIDAYLKKYPSDLVKP